MQKGYTIHFLTKNGLFDYFGGVTMKTQTYFNTKTEQQANVCDLTKPLCVNCAGTVNLSNINNSFHRNDYYLLYIIKGNWI